MSASPFLLASARGVSELCADGVVRSPLGPVTLLDEPVLKPDACVYCAAKMAALVTYVPPNEEVAQTVRLCATHGRMLYARLTDEARRHFSCTGLDA